MRRGRQAESARREADNNLRIAQKQRKVALEAVGQMVTTVRTELLKKPDLQGVLKKVLAIAQSSLDNIAQTANESEQFGTQFALAWGI